VCGVYISFEEELFRDQRVSKRSSWFSEESSFIQDGRRCQHYGDVAAASYTGK